MLRAISSRLDVKGPLASFAYFISLRVSSAEAQPYISMGYPLALAPTSLAPFPSQIKLKMVCTSVSEYEVKSTTPSILRMLCYWSIRLEGSRVKPQATVN
jgi:hypothetical protein